LLTENKAANCSASAPAFEARAVTGGQRRYLVEEKQFRVAIAEHGAVAIRELEHTANPLARRPAPAGEFSMRIVNAPAAIAHHEAAWCDGARLAKRIDTVLQGHGGGQKTRWPGKHTPRPPYPFQEDPVT
jgi:hypothetical protein